MEKKKSLTKQLTEATKNKNEAVIVKNYELASMYREIEKLLLRKLSKEEGPQPPLDALPPNIEKEIEDEFVEFLNSQKLIGKWKNIFESMESTGKTPIEIWKSIPLEFVCGTDCAEEDLEKIATEIFNKLENIPPLTECVCDQLPTNGKILSFRNKRNHTEIAIIEGCNDALMFLQDNSWEIYSIKKSSGEILKLDSELNNYSTNEKVKVKSFDIGEMSNNIFINGGDYEIEKLTMCNFNITKLLYEDVVYSVKRSEKGSQFYNSELDISLPIKYWSTAEVLELKDFEGVTYKIGDSVVNKEFQFVYIISKFETIKDEEKGVRNAIFLTEYGAPFLLRDFEKEYCLDYNQEKCYEGDTVYFIQDTLISECKISHLDTFIDKSEHTFYKNKSIVEALCEENKFKELKFSYEMIEEACKSLINIGSETLLDKLLRNLKKQL